MSVRRLVLDVDALFANVEEAAKSYASTIVEHLTINDRCNCVVEAIICTECSFNSLVKIYRA